MFRYHRLMFITGMILLLSIIQADAADLARLQTELDEKLSAHRAQQVYMNDFVKRVSYLEGEVRRLEVSLENRLKAMEASQTKLISVQQLILSHPEISDARERSHYADAKKAYDDSQQELAQVLNSQAHAQQELRTEQTVLKSIESEINSLRQRIADIQFARLKGEIEREREVIAHGETSCGAMSIQMCMEAALDQARRNAAENGSAVIIDSFTEVKDFELKRDEIRSRVRAIVLRHDVLDSGFIGHSGYYYKIRAIVKGQVPPDFTQVVITPALNEDSPKKPAPQVVPVKTFTPDPPTTPAPVPAPVKVASEYRLTVNTNPTNARVRIMNIVPPYVPGIRLAPGNYHLEVSLPGYQDVNQWIEIENSDKTVFIGLIPVVAAAQTPPPPAQEAAAAVPRPPDIPPHIKALIAQLQSDSPAVVRSAAMSAHRSGDFHPELLRVVNAILQKGYNLNTNDRTHVDAMAWLCNIIGSAGAQQYKSTLEMIAEKADNRKVRNYAARNLRGL